MPASNTSLQNLKNRTISGFFWSLGEQFGRYGIGILITVFLARLLTPKDYGLIGLTTVFFSIAMTLVDGGFRQALIRKLDLSQTDRSTAFFTNLFISVLIYIILFVFAPFIAFFFKEPRLASLIRFMGIQTIIYAFQIVQIADLTRRMDFKTQIKITLPSGIVSGIIAIFLAWKGLGVWSLAVQTVFGSFLSTLLFWFHNRWIPTLEFSRESLRYFFSFGSKLLFSSLIDTVFNNIYLLVIGKFFSTQQLGYYSFSKKIKSLSAEQLTSAFQRVSYPALSMLQNEKEHLTEGYRKVMQYTLCAILPLMVFIGLAAEPLFRLFLNEKWFPAIPYLRILCVIGAIHPLHAINLNVLKVKGRSDLYLKVEIIKKLLISIMIFILLPFGIFPLLVGQAVLSFLSFFINSYYTAQLINYSVFKQICDISGIIVASLIMATVMYLFYLLIPNQNVLLLIVMTPAGIAAYILSCKMMKLKAFSINYDMLAKITYLKKRKRTVVDEKIQNSIIIKQ